MAFWIFKCSPEQYRLSLRLADPNPAISWRVTKYRDDIGPGDTVFIWETGPNRAIRALMRIDDGPCELPELESEQPYNVQRDTETRLRVLGSLTRRGLNLSHEMLRDVPGLENVSIFRKDVYHQATNFPVTPEEGAILSRLVEGVVTTLSGHAQSPRRPIGATPNPAAENLARAAAMLRTEPQPRYEMLLVREGAQVHANLTQNDQRRRLANALDLRQIHDPRPPS